MNKKSISALVVTVLLVAVSIGIGTVLVSWVSSYSTGSVNRAKKATNALDVCSGVQYSIYNVQVVNPNATTNGSISVFLVNTGKFRIDSLFVKVEDSAGDMFFLKPNEGTFHLDSLGKTYVHYTIDPVANHMNCASGCDITYLEFIPVVFDANSNNYLPCSTSHYVVPSNEFSKSNIV